LDLESGGDRFAGARQRVDFYHVSQHLWTVPCLAPDDEAPPKLGAAMLDKLKRTPVAKSSRA